MDNVKGSGNQCIFKEANAGINTKLGYVFVFKTDANIAYILTIFTDNRDFKINSKGYFYSIITDYFDVGLDFKIVLINTAFFNAQFTKINLQTAVGNI